MAHFKLSRGTGFLVVALLATSLSQQAWAAPPTNVAFSLTMSPSARTLNALDEFGEGSTEFMDVWKDASWDNHHLRIHARNKPALMLINDDTSEAPITSFSITINEGPYKFGSGDFITDNFNGFIRENPLFTDAGVSITGSSLSADEKTLTVNFDGLTQGRKVIFNLDLDPTDGSVFPYPDYRVVLCGSPTSGVDPGNMPATIAATFTSTTMGPPNNTRTLAMDLPKDDNVPEYFEHFIRAAKDMEMIEFKEKEVAIPEPSSLLLALAMSGVVSLARRRRSA